MRAPVVEIIEIIRQDLLQLPPIENEQMIQALSPDRSQPALRDCIGPRRSERGANLRDTEVSYTPIEDCAINAVAVIKRKRGGARSQPQHSTICCPVHSAVGY
jgi:hypothetical protein